MVKIVFSKIISTVTSLQGDDNDDDDDEKGNNKERKENRNPKMKKHQGSAGVKSSIPFHSFHSFHSLWICVALLLLHMMKSCDAFDKLPNGNGEGTSSSNRAGSLGGVVDEWIKGGTERATVVDKYGEIEIWDTSDVLSLKNVFWYKDTFNEDISKWDVSSVTNMAQSTSLSFILSFCSCIHKHILN